MTLAITLVTQHGIWASADQKLTNSESGETVAEDSVKHVVFSCSDGTAHISYAGLGRTLNLDLSEWMRSILRGQQRTLGDTLTDIQRQATVQFGKIARNDQPPHIFLVGAFLNGQPSAFELTNFWPPSAFSKGGMRPDFKVSTKIVGRSALLIAGAGQEGITAADLKRLRRAESRRPSDPREYMDLLAEVNRRAAESGTPGASTVSPWANVTHIPPTGLGITSEWYGPKGHSEHAPTFISQVFQGIDLEPMTRLQQEFFQALLKRDRGELTPEEFSEIERKYSENLNEMGRKSIQPLNRADSPEGDES